MKNKTNWLAYNDLAWADQVISGPADYAEETEWLVKALLDHSAGEIGTILHLGCGAGFSDYIFKRHFNVTGVDISPGMLDIARKVNPEISYQLGDMRNIELGECFDAVVIPDSSDYMRTEDELFDAMKTAKKHLKPGGNLLIVAHPAESFIQVRSALDAAFGIGLGEMEWLTINALKSAFAPFDERLALINEVVKPGYAHLHAEAARAVDAG